MRDGKFTGYNPQPVAGVTADERLTVTTRTVSCDGGKGALGHPLIWMRIEAEETTCPYCSRTFVLAAGAEDDGHH